MPKFRVSKQGIREFWNSQVNDEANWATNAKLLRASGLFIGAILFMRNFGDLMTI